MFPTNEGSISIKINRKLGLSVLQNLMHVITIIPLAFFSRAILIISEGEMLKSLLSLFGPTAFLLRQ